MMQAAAPNADICVEFVPQEDQRWRDFLASGQPTLFHTTRWCQLMADEYGFGARVALALLGDRVVGGLPYAEVDDFRGPRRVAYAFSDFCEPLGGPAAWTAIEAALCATSVPWQIRSRVAPSSLAEQVEQPGVHQTILLPRTMAEASAAFHQKQRVNALRLERAGATCRKIEDRSFIEPFYTLFATLRARKFRLLPQSHRFFERVVDMFFPERGHGLLAEMSGKPVAAMLLLSEGDTLYVKYSASDRDFQDLRPTNYLFREAVAASIAAGYRYLDLGISIEPGLQRFKRHLGATEAPFYTARYAQPPKSAAVVQMENALSDLTRVLTEPDVPLSAAISAGNAVYRFFV